MKVLHDLSLRSKSILLMTLTGFAALFFAIIAFIGYELITFRQAAESEGKAIARIVGLNSMASLSFQDTESARETLSSLNGDGAINYAALYDREGNIFALSGGAVSSPSTIPVSLPPAMLAVDTPTVSWSGIELLVHYPVTLEQERLGTVALSTNQTALQQKLATYLGLSTLIFLLSSILAYVFSLFSHRFITEPLRSLQQTMEQVAKSNDYTLQARVWGSDELGRLTERFNAMLTQIREQDKELRFHRELLEDNVRERTVELSEANANLRRTIEELQQAKDRAEAAIQAKMQFLANISHEIRTPMNGVLGIAEILDHSPLSTRQRQLLQTLRQSGADLMVIINDLLDFSKLESGKFDLNISVFNLHQLLDNCIDVFSAEARRKNVEIACIVHPDVPVHIQSDPDRIRQILINLISNALKFTSSGSVVITAQAGEAGGVQGQVIVSVADTGVGIPESFLQKIFSPFTQVDETMTRSHGGTGLGLTIVHQLLTLMDGHIGVTSQVGKGSVFTATIPFIHPEDPPKAAPDMEADVYVETIGLSPLSRTSLDKILARFGLRAVHRADVETPQGSVLPPGKPVFFVAMADDETATARQLELLHRQYDPEKTIILVVPNLTESEMPSSLLINQAITKPLRQSDVQNIILNAAGLGQAPLAEKEAAYPRNVIFPVQALLAEDNKFNQKVAQGALEIFGVTVTIADNGREALEHTLSTRFDIIFTDCQMPVMDGYAASIAIRDHEARLHPGQRVPIVAMTAHAMARDKLRCFQSGMDGYLPKPFTLKDLYRCLIKWLPDRAQKIPESGRIDDSDVSDLDRDSEVLDQTILNSLRSLQSTGSRDLLKSLFAAYRESSSTLVQAIAAAVQDGDGQAIRHNAHTLKSSSHNVGAVALSDMAQEMEALAKSGKTSQLPQLLARLTQEHERVLDALTRHEERL